MVQSIRNVCGSSEPLKFLSVYTRMKSGWFSIIVILLSCCVSYGLAISHSYIFYGIRLFVYKLCVGFIPHYIYKPLFGILFFIAVYSAIVLFTSALLYIIMKYAYGSNSMWLPRRTNDIRIIGIVGIIVFGFAIIIFLTGGIINTYKGNYEFWEVSWVLLLFIILLVGSIWVTTKS